MPLKVFDYAEFINNSSSLLGIFVKCIPGELKLGTFELKVNLKADVMIVSFA